MLNSQTQYTSLIIYNNDHYVYSSATYINVHVQFIFALLVIVCYNVITEDNFNFHVYQVYLAIELSITTESWTVHFVNKI